MCKPAGRFTFLVFARFFSIAGNSTAFGESGDGTARKGHPEGLVRGGSLADVGLYRFSTLLTSGNPLQNHQTGFTQTLSTMGNIAQIASP